jgi:subtilase-type serine protease
VEIRASAAPYVAGQPVTLAVAPVRTSRRITQASWTFGDGSEGTTGIGVSHTWTTAGAYSVTVTATLDGRAVSTSTRLTVTAPGAAQPAGPILPADPNPQAVTPPATDGAVTPPAVTTPAVSTPAVTTPAVTTPAVTTTAAAVKPAAPVITALTDAGDGQAVTLQARYGSAGTGTLVSATISWGSGSLQVLPTDGAASYVVGHLTPGPLTFTLTVCNSESLCTPSAPRSVTVAAAKQAPDVPSLRPASGNWVAYALSYTIYIPTAGSGTVTSATLTLSGGASGTKTIPVGGVPVEVTDGFTGMPAGVDITAVAKVCNSDGACASSAPLTRRAYAPPVAPAITLIQTKNLLVVDWEAASTAGLAPDPSASVTIADLTSPSASTICPATPTAAGRCTMEWIDGHTYQAEYTLTTYPLSDTSRSAKHTVARV